MKKCILSNKYYVTYIDIYLLSKEYELPIILLCNTIIDITITNEKFIIFNLSKNKKYFFLKTPSLYDRNKLHNYKLIINASSVVFDIDKDLKYHPEDDLQSKLQNEIANANFKDVLGNYISNYGLNTKEQIAKDKKAKKQEEKEAKKHEDIKKKAEKQEEKKKKAEKKEKEKEKVKEKVKEQVEGEVKLGQQLEGEVKLGEQVEGEVKVGKEVIPTKPTKSAKTKKTTQTTESKRCPNGTRKNKKTGLCEEIQNKKIS